MFFLDFTRLASVFLRHHRAEIFDALTALFFFGMHLRFFTLQSYIRSLDVSTTSREYEIILLAVVYFLYKFRHVVNDAALGENCGDVFL